MINNVNFAEKYFDHLQARLIADQDLKNKHGNLAVMKKFRDVHKKAMKAYQVVAKEFNIDIDTEIINYSKRKLCNFDTATLKILAEAESSVTHFEHKANNSPSKLEKLHNRFYAEQTKLNMRIAREILLYRESF